MSDRREAGDGDVVYDYPRHNQLQGLEDNPMNRAYLLLKLRIAGLAVLCASSLADGAEVRRLTLAEAVRLAVGQNRQLKIARLKIEENEQKVAYPAEYRSSGVMTFIVSEDGVVYQKDLGRRPMFSRKR